MEVLYRSEEEMKEGCRYPKQFWKDLHRMVVCLCLRRCLFDKTLDEFAQMDYRQTAP